MKLSNKLIFKRRLLLINVQKLDFFILAWENWSPILATGYEVHSLSVIQLLLLTCLPATGTGAFLWGKGPYTGSNVLESSVLVSRECSCWA